VCRGKRLVEDVDGLERWGWRCSRREFTPVCWVPEADDRSRRLCHDSSFLIRLWQRYDNVPNKTKIFTNLVFTLNRVITEKPQLLGTNATIGGINVPTNASSDVFGTPYPYTAGQSSTAAGRPSASGYLDMGLSAVATAASVGVNTVNAMMGNEDEGRLDTSCAIKTQWYVRLLVSGNSS
jgi:hypothetical protein